MNFGTLKKYMIVACSKGQARSPVTAIGHQQSLACQALVVLLCDTVYIPFVWFLNKCLCLCNEAFPTARVVIQTGAKVA
jgi:hypothetical protein